MTLLGSKYRKKVSSISLEGSTSATSSNRDATSQQQTTIYPHQSTLLSRLPPNVSTPTIYQQQQYNTNLSSHTSSPFSTQYTTSSMIAPFDSPTPTPSTSWTSEMSAFVDKLRDDAAAIVGSTKYQQQILQKQQQQVPLDRRSVSQGMKLVAIAADEYEEGNDDVALDIYLSGIDKILMALPNKTDPRTKMALREKLLSMEERVGILNIALHYKRPTVLEDDMDKEIDLESTTTPTTTTSILSRISTTINTITSIGTTTAKTWETNNVVMQRYDHHQQQPQDLILRFKRFGRFVVNASVTCAVVIKQSPIPDLIGLIFSYLIHILCYLDHQYKVREKVSQFGIECIKLVLAANEHYHLHELASETLYTLVAASLKAAVAFKESPSYRQSNSSPSSPSSDTNVDHVKGIPQIEYQDPPPPSRLPWILSGWS